MPWLPSRLCRHRAAFLRLGECPVGGCGWDAEILDDVAANGREPTGAYARHSDNGFFNSANDRGAFAERQRCLAVNAPNAAVAMLRIALVGLVDDKGSAEAKSERQLKT